MWLPKKGENENQPQNIPCQTHAMYGSERKQMFRPEHPAQTAINFLLI